MQTFLPYSNFSDTADILDNKRLGKQRVEGYQILRTLRGESNGWKNHPAVVMWRGYETALLRYTRIICFEWLNRGYRDTILDKLDAIPLDHDKSMPPWWASIGRLSATHRANLYLKDPEHYPASWERDIFELDSLVCCFPKCKYYWPSHDVNAAW